MPVVLKLAQLDLKLLEEEILSVLDRHLQQIAGAKELRLIVGDNTGVGRDAHLAIGEEVERVDGLIRRDAGGELDVELYILGGIIRYALDLDLAAVVSLQDAIDKRRRSDAVRDIADDKGLCVQLFDACPYANLASARAIVIVGHVNHAARLEIGVKLKATALEVPDSGLDELAEIVRKNLSREAHRNAVCALREQQRELHRECYRLIFASIVRELPCCGLAIESNLIGELRKAGLDVTWCGCGVARAHIAPVTLRLDEKIFLPEVHHRVADGCITVRVVLHGLSDDICHLIEPSIIHLLHGMHDAALHRFQSIFYCGDGTLENYVAGVVKEPALVHIVDENRLCFGVFGLLLIFHLCSYKTIRRQGVPATR